MVEMTALLLALGGDRLNALAELRIPVFRCGVASGLLRTADRIYQSTTANREGWIYIRVFSPKALPALETYR
jgi:hypothetical protein